MKDVKKNIIKNTFNFTCIETDIHQFYRNIDIAKPRRFCASSGTEEYVVNYDALTSLWRVGEVNHAEREITRVVNLY